MYFSTTNPVVIPEPLPLPTTEFQMRKGNVGAIYLNIQMCIQQRLGCLPTPQWSKCRSGQVRRRFFLKSICGPRRDNFQTAPRAVVERARVSKCESSAPGVAGPKSNIETSLAQGSTQPSLEESKFGPEVSNQPPSSQPEEATSGPEVSNKPPSSQPEEEKNELAPHSQTFGLYFAYPELGVSCRLRGKLDNERPGVARIVTVDRGEEEEETQDSAQFELAEDQQLADYQQPAGGTTAQSTA